MASEPAAARGHIPVMKSEVLELLDVQPGFVVVDCTAGGGGHLRAFAELVGPHGKVIGLDRDERAFRDDAAGGVRSQFSDRVLLVKSAFADVRAALDEVGVDRVDALFADLGVSSFQLDEADRGFSFRADAPLDMRMDTTTGETAKELIERLDEEELANLIYELGDERKSRRIARALKRRPIPSTTQELADVVARAVGGPWKRIHPATRTFQALRIAVNGELDQLDALLKALPDVVKPGGRAAILSFHSLEDGRVKRCFRSEGFHPITKRPLEPTDDEVAQNPRSRSARLRAAVVGGDDAGQDNEVSR
jgi:16S rRNA (cytosine1402-N4)-methyltransferase